MKHLIRKPLLPLLILGIMVFSACFLSDFQEGIRCDKERVDGLYDSTVPENVLYHFGLSKIPHDEALKRAKSYLGAVDIPEELYNRIPAKLSGGEQQRVAIARSCIRCESYCRG